MNLLKLKIKSKLKQLFCNHKWTHEFWTHGNTSVNKKNY